MTVFCVALATADSLRTDSVLIASSHEFLSLKLGEKLGEKLSLYTSHRLQLLVLPTLS